MTTPDHAAVMAGLVRERDPDSYYATMLAPPDRRAALFALAAFSAEVARVREQVSNPMPGEIRLQWWRDAIAGEARGDIAGSPVAASLEEAITRFRLPRSALLDLVDARVFDLYDDPMTSVADLEGYLGETSSALIRLGTIVLVDGADPGAADAAGHAGLAIGLTGLLRALPWHAREGRLFLPADVLSRHGVTRDDVVLGRGGPGLLGALVELRALARRHLDAARSRRVPSELRPAFAPLALVPPYLAAMERPGYDPFRSVVEVPGWSRIARIWWAARRGV